MTDPMTSPLEPNERQLARPGLEGHSPSTPLDPSPEQIHGLRAAGPATPLDPIGEWVYHLGSDGNKQTVPLDPTPEQLHRLGLDPSPKSPYAPKR